LGDVVSPLTDIYKSIDETGQYTDWRGNTVAVGSTVVYAVSECSSPRLREAEVIGFKPGKTTVRRRTQTPQGERWLPVEVTSYRLHVRPLRASDRWGPKNNSYVNNLEKVIAID
jgi:hypothetical protein